MMPGVLPQRRRDCCVPAEKACFLKHVGCRDVVPGIFGGYHEENRTKTIHNQGRA
jgi:hypothetical protein